MIQESSKSARSRYWRSLNELRQTPEFRSMLEREFPVAASEYPEGVSRRRWIQLMGASLALGGVIGCRYPEEKIAPFVIRPEGRVPGEMYGRATNYELAGRVYNLLVTCVDGRPIKIEGNVGHPCGRGGTDVYSQASILGLYDPDRLDGVKHFRDQRLRDSSWEGLEEHLIGMRARLKGSKGRNFAVVVESTSSPSLVAMLTRVKEVYPEVTFVRVDSLGMDVVREATRIAIGREAAPTLHLQEAETILTVEADILGQDRGMVQTSRGFVEGRDPIAKRMSRLYAVEAGYTNTGASADSRLALRPSDAIRFLAAVEKLIDAGATSADPKDGEVPFDEIADPTERMGRFLEVAAADLIMGGEKSVVVVGEHLGTEAVAAGIRINNKLGSLNKLIRFPEPVDSKLPVEKLPELITEIESGKIDSVLVLADNPVFNAPSDQDLGAALSRLDETFYLGLYADETAAVCKWRLPLAHPLESWGDVICGDGHYGVCQPQIQPLLRGRSTLEVLAAIVDSDAKSGEQIVRTTADAVAGADLSDRQWRTLLHDGFHEQLLVPSAEANFSGASDPLTEEAIELGGDFDQDDFEIVFCASDGLYDGRFANNGWLQEMPQSLTKLTWDNAALVSPRTARAIGVAHGRLLALRRNGVTLELPVYEMPGMAHGCAVVPIGYGRTRVGVVGGHVDIDAPTVGVDVAPLRTSDARLVAFGAEARPRAETYNLATTQDHWAIDELGRDETQFRSYKLVREGTLELLHTMPKFADAKAPHVPPDSHTQLWQEPIQKIVEEGKEHVPQWGMAVDLSKCTGCNACVVACQSENNVPIVGKPQVLMNREMHWIRIDRYFQGDEDYADVVQEPLMCMHCETAPCEQVCPVAATVHTEEGINAMAYNRCIGTRYCANNCPFKVRRFNYFNYNEDIGVGYGIKAFPGTIESANRKLQQLVLNPEVTVRGRGVMEKCTYCIQRIEEGKIAARREGRLVQDGDVKTACQTACPTRAIEFGNIADPTSKVAQLRSDVRSYGMLPQLRVRPRTEYLARIRNTHPRLMTSKQIWDLKHLHEHAHHHDDHHHDDPEHSSEKS